MNTDPISSNPPFTGSPKTICFSQDLSQMGFCNYLCDYLIPLCILHQIVNSMKVGAMFSFPHFYFQHLVQCQTQSRLSVSIYHRKKSGKKEWKKRMEERRKEEDRSLSSLHLSMCTWSIGLVSEIYILRQKLTRIYQKRETRKVREGKVGLKYQIVGSFLQFLLIKRFCFKKNI